MDASGPAATGRAAPHWTRLYLAGVASVYAAATGGPPLAANAAGFALPAGPLPRWAAAELAAPLRGESYAAYLQRVSAAALDFEAVQSEV